MNDLQKALETTEATIEALQSYAVYGDWRIISDGDVFKCETSKNAREFGMERPTQKQAERAAIEMRKFNRLLALRDELCGDEAVDWSKDEAKYFLCCDEEKKTWDVHANFRQNNSSVYFTTRESANRACEMLNSGEVVL